MMGKPSGVFINDEAAATGYRDAIVQIAWSQRELDRAVLVSVQYRHEHEMSEALTVARTLLCKVAGMSLPEALARIAHDVRTEMS